MPVDTEKLARLLVCPACRSSLASSPDGLLCTAEDRVFPVEPNGYVDFVPAGPPPAGQTDDTYVAIQHASGDGPLERYVRPWLDQDACSTVLDLGCGVGIGVGTLIAEGVNAFGVDLPNLAPYWAKRGNSPDHFFCADALHLPFPDAMFDAIWSFGVIEHIGTVSGNSLLRADYLHQRVLFAAEVLRVLKPRGRLLLACPNKRFPVDVQHKPGDPDQLAHPAKEWVWRHGHVTLHRTWGRYFLPTYRDVEHYFRRPVRALPLRGYFGYQGFAHAALRPFRRLAAGYVDNLPAPLRRTSLNPYILAEVRK